MTTANKILAGLLLTVAALGGAFGGGYYVDMKQRRVVEKKLDEVQKKATATEDQLTKDLLRAHGRSQLVEAALAEVYQNHGMAFDRTVRTQSIAGRLGLNIQAELDDVRNLIMGQKPEAVSKLLTLADKFEPVVGVTLPTKQPPVVAKAPPLAGPATAPAAPALAVAPAAAPAPAAVSELEPAREALRQAKESLLVGGDMQEIARKLARARVLLNETGNTSLDAELSSAIKATRSHDDDRVRASIDAALASLRSP